jgi:hypothetical protein
MPDSQTQQIPDDRDVHCGRWCSAVFGTVLNDPLTMAGAAGIVVITASAGAILSAWRMLHLNVAAVLNSR